MILNARKFMTSKEVAKLLQVSYSTVRRLIYDGELKGYKIRSSLRFSYTDIEEYLENSRIEKPQIYECKKNIKDLVC